jgi:hypothetical protein
MRDAALRRRRLPRWRVITLVVTTILCLAVLSGGTLLQNWRSARSADLLGKRLTSDDLALSETDLQVKMIPTIDRPDLSITLTDLPATDKGRAEALLSEALAVYPDGFLHRVVDRIILAGNIGFWSGQEVGGFYFDRGIAVNCRGMEPAYITRDIHHELSSLVRRAATPADSAWTAANPPGFHYLSMDAYRAMMRDGTSDTTGPALYAEGFVRNYGKTTLDNDYNTYAERMFSDGPAFASLIKAYPRMRAKAQLVIASYVQVDPAMAAYFERTGLQDATKPTVVAR